jgi:zinc/manganese transport system permease protein
VNPHLSINPLTDLHQMLVYPFMVHALEAGTIVAVMASVAGWYMVLRRETFAGHTLSLMSFPGASGAALVGLPLTSGYFGFCVLGALLIAAGSRTAGRRRPPQESAVIGTVQQPRCARVPVPQPLRRHPREPAGAALRLVPRDHDRRRADPRRRHDRRARLLRLAGRPLLFASVDEQTAAARGVPVLAGRRVPGRAGARGRRHRADNRRAARLRAARRACRVRTQLTARIPLSLALSVVFALAIAWVGLTLAYVSTYSLGFYVSMLAFGLYLVCLAGRALASA